MTQFEKAQLVVSRLLIDTTALAVLEQIVWGNQNAGHDRHDGSIPDDE